MVIIALNVSSFDMLSNIFLSQLRKSYKQQPIPSLHSLHFNPVGVLTAPHRVPPAPNRHRLPSYLAIKVLAHPPSPVLHRPPHDHLRTTLRTSSYHASPHSLSAYMRHRGSVIVIASSEKNRTVHLGMQRKGIRNELRRKWQKRERNKREIG